jgi:hypothetical protein
MPATIWNRIRLAGALFIASILASPASAQQLSPFSLVVSYPAPTVSVEWQLSNRFALRFEGSYNFSKESTEEPLEASTFEHVYLDGTSSVGTSSSGGFRAEWVSRTASIGVAAVITLRRSGDLHLYMAPRVAMDLERHESQIEDLNPPPFFDSSGSFSLTTRSPSAGAAFGASVIMRPRLSLFGEAGVSYRKTGQPLLSGDTAGPVWLPEDRLTMITTRAVGGIMFRF